MDAEGESVNVGVGCGGNEEPEIPAVEQAEGGEVIPVLIEGIVDQLSGNISGIMGISTVVCDAETRPCSPSAQEGIDNQGIIQGEATEGGNSRTIAVQEPTTVGETSGVEVGPGVGSQLDVEAGTTGPQMPGVSTLGIIPVTRRVVDGGILKLEDVLNPEAVFNYDTGLEDAVCIKAKLDHPLLTTDEFNKIINSIEGLPVLIEEGSQSYGEAAVLEFNFKEFSPASFRDQSEPFNFITSLLKRRYNKVRKETSLEKWLNVGGVLPTFFPNLNGASNPVHSFIVAGGHVPLHRAYFKFGAVCYIAKGETCWQIVPPEKYDEATGAVKDVLIENRCRRDLTRCEDFLQHRMFYIDPDFLKSRLNATELILREGDIVFFQPRTYFQMFARSNCMTISYQCIPSSWIELDPIEKCVCGPYTVVDEDTASDMIELREHVVRQNNYGATLKKLWESRTRAPSTTYRDLRYETIIKIQKKYMGNPSKSGRNVQLRNAVRDTTDDEDDGDEEEDVDDEDEDEEEDGNDGDGENDGDDGDEEEDGYEVNSGNEKNDVDEEDRGNDADEEGGGDDGDDAAGKFSSERDTERSQPVVEPQPSGSTATKGKRVLIISSSEEEENHETSASKAKKLKIMRRLRLSMRTTDAGKEDDSGSQDEDTRRIGVRCGMCKKSFKDNYSFGVHTEACRASQQPQ